MYVVYVAVTIRYNGATGAFTVPYNKAGLYFVSMHLFFNDRKWAFFYIYQNYEILCGVHEDHRDSPNGNGVGGCSVTVELNAGKNNNSYYF